VIKNVYWALHKVLVILVGF